MPVGQARSTRSLAHSAQHCATMGSPSLGTAAPPPPSAPPHRAPAKMTAANEDKPLKQTRACSRSDWGCRWLAAASATESRPRGKAPPSPSPSRRGQMAACDARTSPAPPRPLRVQRGIGRLGGSGGLSRAPISSRSRAHKLISHRGGHLDGHLGVHIGGSDLSGPRARWSAEMSIR